jgi:hypothetical protein
MDCDRQQIFQYSTAQRQGQMSTCEEKIPVWATLENQGKSLDPDNGSDPVQ